MPAPHPLLATSLAAALTVLSPFRLAAAEPPAVIIDVRSFGAIGDGRIHRVSEWIDQGRFRNLAALRRVYPFIDDLNWSIDEAAFAAAKRALPARGGTIHFPAGHYVAARDAWRIDRDHVTLTGDGMPRTILSTGPGVAEGLVLSPYRHGGWIEGAAREFPFAASSGARGESFVALKDAAWAQDFQPGELVFIRNGANRFDQDYGEFNEVARVSDDGRLELVHPLARDYTLARLNWAGEVARDFAMPREGASVRVELRRGEGFFTPAVHDTLTVGDNVFAITNVGPGSLRITNPGRGNAPRGTVISAGTRIAKARTIVKLTRSTRDFRCENLQIVGRRKALNLANSYESVFVGCAFVRDLRDGGFTGGLTIDGDGGRFARFERCRIMARPAVGMQFARSFGNVAFTGCEFVDTNVAFTEFCFDGEVVGCTFDVEGAPALTGVIIAGKSCGNLRLVDNRIVATGVAAVFDTVSDIHSQKHGGEGEIVVRGNQIRVDRGVRLFTAPKSARLALGDNTVNPR